MGKAEGKMATTTGTYLQSQLEDRRKRLETAIASPAANASLAALLGEVDAALERMRDGSFGICEECHEPVEQERLLADPLVRLCLDHLSEPQRRALEQDLELASGVQRALLPPRNFRADGWQIHYCYEPAGMVSGDYCDVIPADGPGEASRDVFLALGDVSGKGVAASLLMTQLHGMFRSLAGSNLSLDQLLGRVNRLFCESTTAGQYATLVCRARFCFRRGGTLQRGPSACFSAAKWRDALARSHWHAAWNVLLRRLSSRKHSARRR